MPLFGDLDVRLDPWEAEYGSEIPLEPSEDDAEDVARDVEVPAADWRPIIPASPAIPRRWVFVDGVRRLEARLIARRETRLVHGAFGSYAVGAIAVEGGRAVLERARADRIVVLGSGEALPGEIAVRPALTYRPVSTGSLDAEGPLRAIQVEMRLAEERLGRELAEKEHTLVVADGPLSFEDPVRGATVGYVKRIFKLYLPESEIGFLARLPAGARTPLFFLRATRRFARYAWFLRLVAPPPGASELSGLVRLEVSEAVGVLAARRLADATAFVLPRFAPGRGRDPRSPQNLLPIGALEARLRRELGDGRLIRRQLESLLARERRKP